MFKLTAGYCSYKKVYGWDLPSGPVVTNLHFITGGRGSITGRGTKIPHAVWCDQKITRNKF